MVLAADGSGWSVLEPMSTARSDMGTALLPCGRVLVAGGQTAANDDGDRRAVDPATGAWTNLPPHGTRGGQALAAVCYRAAGWW